MTDFNFHSTDPDNFNEVYCPVIYTGTSPMVKWCVSDITSNHYIVVLSPEDYVEVNNVKYNLQKTYLAVTESLMTDLNEIFSANDLLIILEKNDLDQYYFTDKSPFIINSMSYNMKQALGFYCDNFPLSSDSDYKITAKGVGFTNFSPVWFLISNLGQPIQINKEDSPWKPIFPAVVMKIQNSFQEGQPIVYSNSDYVSTSPPAALSNLRVKLVDSNLVPIKLLNPLYVSVSLSEISDEERKPTEEALAEQKENPETKQLIRVTVSKYHEVKETNQNKVEAGVNVEPQADLMMAEIQDKLYYNDVATKPVNNFIANEAPLQNASL